MNYNANRGRVHQSEYQAQKMITPSSIIRRREIEPLLLKAEETLRLYEKAAGVGVSVLNETGHSLPSFASRDAVRFCSLCRAHCQNQDQIWAEDEYPCTWMHQEAIAEAQRRGGIYIYVCGLGFTFWVSPLTRHGRCAGACVAGGILGIGREVCIERISGLDRGAISREAAEALLLDIPEKTHSKIKSLARLLHLCAEHISKNAEGPGKPNAAAQDAPADQERGAANRGYPLDKERMLLAALRRGDNDTAQKILGGLLENLRSSNPGDFRFIQLRAIELVVLLSRAAVRQSSAQETLDTNNRYLERIQEARNLEELTDILHLIMDRMAGQIFSFQGIRHASALRRAERYIWENYTRRLSLQEIAAASGLSAPYFSSIFKQEMGESLSNYLNRLRVERAVSMLAESNLPLHGISKACGFEDQSWFSKIFKSFTGVSPGKYRERGMAMPIDRAAGACPPEGEA